VTLDDVFQALLDRDSALVVSGGRLRYVGPEPLTDADPLRDGIAQHRAVLIELFTYVPEGRCVEATCYRIRVEGDIRCPDHTCARDASVREEAA
jgi:hypothetical protein